MSLNSVFCWFVFWSMACVSACDHINMNVHGAELDKKNGAKNIDIFGTRHSTLNTLTTAWCGKFFNIHGMFFFRMILCCFFFGCQVRQINKKYVQVTFQFQGLEKKSYFWWLRSLHFLTLHALRSSKCLAGYGEPHQISTLEIHQHICGMNALNVFGSLQWKQIQKTTRTYTNAIISVRMLTCACVHVPLLVPGSQPEKTQFCFRHCFAFNLGKLIFGHWQQIDSPWSAFLSCIFDFEIW